jgi:hypothetical protein
VQRARTENVPDVREHQPGTLSLKGDRKGVGMYSGFAGDVDSPAELAAKYGEVRAHWAPASTRVQQDASVTDHAKRGWASYLECARIREITRGEASAVMLPVVAAFREAAMEADRVATRAAMRLAASEGRGADYSALKAEVQSVAGEPCTHFPGSGTCTRVAPEAEAGQ